MTPVAVHEASHAVARWALDCEVPRLELHDDGSGLTIPQCRGLDVPFDTWMTLLRAQLPAVQTAHLHKRLWLSLSGPAGDHHLRGLTCWDGQNDAAEVHACCMALEIPPWRVFPRIQQRLREAWPAVEALATELAWLRTVEPSRVTEILTPYIEPGTWLKELACSVS